MKILKLTLLALASQVALAGGEAVEVRFDQPEKFSDVRLANYPSAKARDELLADLARHLERRATARLDPGTRLTVTVTDVDMAGEFEYSRGPLSGTPRIVRDIYPPRIDLSFRLAASDGAVLREGRRELRNSAFLITAPLEVTGMLRHEKALLNAWVEREFPRGAKQPPVETK